MSHNRSDIDYLRLKWNEDLGMNQFQWKSVVQNIKTSAVDLRNLTQQKVVRHLHQAASKLKKLNIVPGDTC